MIYKELKYWIAQSESFQSFKEFQLADDLMSKYEFYQRPTDFYISLIGQIFDVIEGEMTSERRSDILSIAKGLEVFALKGKRENFKGVNYNFNLLLVASLYTLTDFPSSASLIVKHLVEDDFNHDVELFLLLVLQRKYNKKHSKNELYALLYEYLTKGSSKTFKSIYEILDKYSEHGNMSDPKEFVIVEVTRKVISKFSLDNLWHDLVAYNKRSYWKDFVILNYQKKYSVWNFFPSQRAAIKDGLLTIKNSMALQMPTSSGKTTVTELAIFNELRSNPNAKVLYLAPYRALASELKLSLGKNLSKLNILTKTVYGGNYPTLLERTSLDDAQLVISTPEKFMAFEDFDPSLTQRFSLVICDEGHLIDDSSRGLSYELLLSRMKREHNMKFLFISAIIPNIEIINSWLGGRSTDVVKSLYRPTEIQFAVLKEADQGNFTLDVNPTKAIPENYKLNKFIQPADLQYTNSRGTKYVFDLNKKKRTKSLIISLKALPSGNVALFAPEKSERTGVYGLAKEMNEILSYNISLPKCEDYADMEYLKKLQQYLDVVFGKDYLLNIACEKGFLFHHGDIPQFIRELIEEAIRTERIKLIICTNTLAEGVNLPIRNVVIHSTKRFNAFSNTQSPIRNRDLKNLIGRAGRAGKETKGLVILPHISDLDVVKPIIENQGAEEIKGYLFYTVSAINRYLRTKALVLSNELLEDLDEVDSIDTAIIDLLSEEANPADLKSYIESLAKETLTYYQANEEIRGELQNLFAIRGNKLNTFIESGDYQYIKNSGINIRNYEAIYKNVDFDNDKIWLETNEADNSEFLRFMINTCYELKTIGNYTLDSAGELNPKFERKTTETLINLWLNGSWYEELSNVLNTNVIETLPIMNNFICYNIQNVCANIIRVAQLKRNSNKKEMSSVVVNWPNYLLYGIKSPLQLNLVELGFVDRILIWELSKMLQKNRRVAIDNTGALKELLQNNRDEYLAQLKEVLPEISYEKASESFYDLDYKMI